MINPIYKLTEEERRLAEKLGRGRNNAKDISFRNKWYGFPENPESSHVLGVAAEIAYAALTKQKLDENFYALGDDMDFDGIEVKTATWPYPDIELKIKVSEYEKKKPRAYVLARIDKNYTTVEFIGSITRKQFDKIKYFKHHRYVDNYCVDGRQMDKGLGFVEDSILKILNFEQPQKIGTP